MRTTIELSDLHRGILHQLSLKRGWRGYSRIIEEAIDFYLTHRATGKERLEMLRLKGAFGHREAALLRDRIKEVRSNWKE